MKQKDNDFIYFGGWKPLNFQMTKYFDRGKWKSLGKIYKTDFFQKYKKIIGNKEEDKIPKHMVGNFVGQKKKQKKKRRKKKSGKKKVSVKKKLKGEIKKAEKRIKKLDKAKRKLELRNKFRERILSDFIFRNH